MKQIIINLIKTYFKFVMIFMLEKPIFMLYNLDLYKDVDFSDWFKVIWHGLSMDLSISAYLMMIPLLFRVASVWVNGDWFKFINTLYTLVITLAISIIFIVDFELYQYWGFRLDSTPIFYLNNPSSALASVSAWQYILVPILILILWFVIYNTITNKTKERYLGFSVLERGRDCLTYILIMGILFVPLRGGTSVSTMNVGRAYFSDKLVLNHAAINPVFSLFSSLAAENNLSSQFRFMDDEMAEKVFNNLNYNNSDKNTTIVFDTIGYHSDTIIIDTPKNKRSRRGKNADSSPLYKIVRTPIIEERTNKPLLNTKKPNILFIVLESFSAKVVEPLGGISNVAPNLNKLYNEGVSFSNFYANSFRTDRGLVSILSGYPAQPTTSIMKYPAKTQSLPSISGSLKKNGYKDLQFIYGGDADFTNMRGYFLSAGFEKIVCDKNFPISQRLTKWGVRDDLTFSFLLNEIQNEDKMRNSDTESENSAPFFKMFLTLSSHEPFDVPTIGYDSPYLNSVAYTDSCLGVFIDEFKKTELWNNTLIVLVPDHSYIYPATMSNVEPDRYHIPMIWTGGAITRGVTVDTYGSQIDIAATLLNELDIDASEFKFSKNLRSEDFNHFAYYTFKSGFGIMNDTVMSVYNCEATESFDIKNISQDKERYKKYFNIDNIELEDKGKAFLQVLYNDIDAR